jgi:hypothetical protein
MNVAIELSTPGSAEFRVTEPTTFKDSCVHLTKKPVTLAV